MDIFKKLNIIEKVEQIENMLYARVPTEQIKSELGISKHELSHYRRISRCLSETAKALIKRSSLTDAHARTLTRLNHQTQEKLVREAIAKRWRVAKLVEQVNLAMEGRELNLDAGYYENLAERISTQIGHPVKVLPGKKSQSVGVLEISYFNFDEFDGIMKRLRVKLDEDEF